MEVIKLKESRVKNVNQVLQMVMINLQNQQKD